MNAADVPVHDKLKTNQAKKQNTCHHIWISLDIRLTVMFHI